MRASGAHLPLEHEQVWRYRPEKTGESKAQAHKRPHALRKHGGKVERKSHNGGDLGKEILAHQAGKKAPSHFLSVVPPLPDLQRLGPEAQKSLENLTLALSMS